MADRAISRVAARKAAQIVNKNNTDLIRYMICSIYLFYLNISLKYIAAEASYVDFLRQTHILDR